MRLLLDEHLSPRIAARLREAGHDVIAVAERDDLRGRPDEEIWQAAIADGRALVSGDLVDFLALATAATGDALLALVSRTRFPRSLDGIGVVASALDALLRDPDRVHGPIHWLEPND